MTIRVVPSIALLFVALGAGTICFAAPANPGGADPNTPIAAEDTAPYQATVRVDLGAAGRPVNRQLLGSNVQWIDRGDDLLNRDGSSFNAPRLALVKAMGPTVLRYPGGSLSETFHWAASLGPLSARAPMEVYFTRKTQRPDFGVAELLALARETGATPLFTVNLATGTAQEAAMWVERVNRTGITAADGVRYPRVPYWELSNEPYYTEDNRKDLAVDPAEYARRANAAARTMRQTDPGILIGLPLHSDTVGAFPLPIQNRRFDSIVLAKLDQRVDFVSLHDAYFPFLWDPKARFTEAQLYHTVMAASRAVEADMEHTRAALRRNAFTREAKLAVTEYSPLFSLGMKTDPYTASAAGALYLADVLRLFTEQDDMLLATYWSLSGNAYFGVIDQNGNPRPAYFVLSAYNEILRGRLLPVQIESPTYDSPQLGLVPAYRGTPSLAAVMTRDGNQVQLLLINREASRATTVTFAPRGEMRVARVSQSNFGSGKLFGTDGRVPPWATAPIAVTRGPLTIIVPPHSLAWVRIDIAP